jgi:hypothetical protein
MKEFNKGTKPIFSQLSNQHQYMERMGILDGSNSYRYFNACLLSGIESIRYS